jgi:N-acetylglutamate synthase-like GNAT family acetyltransferase
MKIIEAKTKEELEKYYSLRYEILRKPWDQPAHTTRDEHENISFHAVAIDDDGNAAATGRLQFNSPEEAQIRSMAVRTDLQSSGIGTKVLRFVEDHARSKGIKRLVLDARDNAVKFYEKNGYSVVGDSYVLFGKIVHFRMEKNL